jgi:divalent metal cation (Fe/Co/Zn/Cd) transporter
VTVPAATSSAERLRRRSLLLVWATIGWNVVEAVVAIGAGVAAGSGALVGFGLDSTVEVSAAVVALWYLRGEDDERGLVAGRLIGVSFWALASWVTVDAVGSLVTGDRPDVSAVGIALTLVSVIVMPSLAIAKRRNAEALGSKALVSESNETMVCAYLSVAVLVGLTANAVLGWWWADPAAALVVAAIAAREGLEAWRGELLDEDGCC